MSILLYNQTGAAYKSLVKMNVLKSNNNVAVLSPRFRDVLLLILNHANQQFLTVAISTLVSVHSLVEFPSLVSVHSLVAIPSLVAIHSLVEFPSLVAIHLLVAVHSLGGRSHIT